jgi:hypothetical protein
MAKKNFLLDELLEFQPKTSFTRHKVVRPAGQSQNTVTSPSGT